MAETLQAPFPFFGGKSSAAPLIWARLGQVPNYVEPFAGSLAVLLGNPQPPPIETVNDLDGFIANFWRAMKAAPAEVAEWAGAPVNENDLHARHAWLVPRRAELTKRLEGDPDYYDAKIAGWWVWGLCCWIGSGWCSGNGPWHVEDKRLVAGGEGGIKRKRPHLGNAGQGVNRKRPHLAGQGVNRKGQDLIPWFNALAERLRRVRVCCGDWTRVLGPTVTFKHSLTAVVLDPPYSGAERAAGIYAQDDGNVATKVREWAIENGDNPLLRVALCGYTGEHAMPAGRHAETWKTRGGYGSQSEGRGRANRTREIVWFSPHCLSAGLFG